MILFCSFEININPIFNAGQMKNNGAFHFNINKSAFAIFVKSTDEIENKLLKAAATTKTIQITTAAMNRK